MPAFGPLDPVHSGFMSRYLALFDAAGQLSSLQDAEFIAMLQLMGRFAAVSCVACVLLEVAVAMRSGLCARACLGGTQPSSGAFRQSTIHNTLPTGVLPHAKGASSGGGIPVLPRCETRY